MNNQQQAFLEKLAQRIPRLFEVISQGNEKSEYIVGIRRIGQRQVRLKLVAEIVDPGGSPLASHGMLRSVSELTLAEESGPVTADDNQSAPASRRRRSRKR